MNSNQPTTSIQWIKRNWIYLLFSVSVMLFVYKQWIAPKNAGEWVSLTYTTYHTPLGWGYDVLVNDTLFIHQQQMPAVEGLRGFATQQEAAAVAELIIYRIQNKQLPTILLKDLDSLHIGH
jgi:hypothetical protein